jgi:ribosomal protein S21
MGRKATNVKVHARQCGNNPERMIRRFIKKCKKEKIIEEAREKRYHKKPSEAKKDKRARSARRVQREKQKLIRVQERRNRKNR